MKNLVTLLAFISLQSYGQIFTQSSANGSITITPKGFQGQANPSTDTTNTALGSTALRSISTTGNRKYNTAIGNMTLARNTTGYSNTAIGHSALARNTIGQLNTATGVDALPDNTYGNYNTAHGVATLYTNTVGNNNTAIGYFAGAYNTTGHNNTFLGYNANFYSSNSSMINATAIGANATVNASNKVRIGNNTVTVIEGQVAYSYPSDRRLKENILYTSRLGLDFINRLQTVSYSYISDKTKMRHDGFIAQDIEEVMKELNVPFSGLKKADDGTYSLAYSDFVMPLVNAVKEQQTEINELKKKLSRMEELERRLSALETNATAAPTGK